MQETKKRAAAGTISLRDIIDDTIKKIKAIDENANWDRSEKTRRHRALAESVKNKLHEDGRKREDHKVSLATYRRYMTNVRSAITKQNWHHHSLESKINTLVNKYPELGDKIESIPHKSISDTRKTHHAVLKDVRHSSQAYEDIKALKLDHEVMRWLTLPSAKKDQLAEEQKQALTAKKHSTVNIEYPWLMATIENLLAPDTSKANISFSRLALGIAMATGRRAIEVLYQGKFEKVGKYELLFSGAAKKRGGADYSQQYRIYSLVPATDVLAAIALLKSQPEIQALDEFSALDETDRNTAIHRKTNKTLNMTTKRVWGDDDRKYKDSRAIWARIVFEQHFKTDKRWAKVDEDIFWHEMLCHEDDETQKAYKQFKIIDLGKTIDKTASGTRLDGVKNLLNDPAISSRGALLKITNWAINTLEKNPEATINQHKITEGCGSGRQVIKDWKALAEDALKLPVSGEAVEPEPQKTEPASKKVKQVETKPRIKAHEIRDGFWQIDVIVGDKTHEYIIPTASKTDAMQQAWDAYLDENSSL